MTSRERFFTAIRHEEPDRIPYVGFLFADHINQLNADCGADYREYYKEDIRLVSVDYPEYKDKNLDNNYFPLPSAAALEKAYAEIQSVKDKGLVACNTYIPGIFEHIKALTNDEYALVHMMLEPDDMKIKISRVTDWLCALYEAFAKIGFDICFNGDDIGTQQSTIMGIDKYREFYKPNHIKLVETIKSVNNNAQTAFHCCGHIHTILPEWIDVGVDIIHSVQPEANDLRFIKENYGRDIVFWGALGLQSEMFYLTLDEMQERLIDCFKILAPGGGFIAGTSNYVTNEVPFDKIKLMYETLMNHGAYPF